MQQTIDQKDLYLSAFEGFEKRLNGKSASPLHLVRRAAIARFAELGFPTTRDEAWRTTSVAPITKVAFRPATGYDPQGLTAGQLAPFLFEGLAGSRLVFVNGHYSPELSSLRPLPKGARAGSLAAALASDPEAVEPHLARYARYQDHAFAALNTAFIQDGAFVRIPKGAVLEDPVHLLFVSTARGEAIVSHPRSLILAEADSRATIIESYVGPDRGVSFTNGVTEVVAGENAVVDHCKIQREASEAFHVATFHAHQGRGSRLSTHAISLGGGLVRNDVVVALDGEDAQATLNGFYLTDGRQHVDNHTWIEHIQPYCTSRELYKGILDGESRGVFRGRIFVHPMAHRAGRGQLLVDAIQSNPNLLLSDGAEVNTRPQLEIYADDVRCTHGATVGQLDENAIFYLRSRGIGLEEARQILVKAFADEVLNLIQAEPVRAQLERLVSQKLEAGRGVREAR
jgi:Fe-S cluster assembly protein SufD